MPAVIDPVTGLEFYELSHRWGMYTPIFPRLRGDQARTHHAPRQAGRDDAQDHDDLPHLDARQRADPSGPRRGGRRRARAGSVFRQWRRRWRFRKRKWQLIEPTDLGTREAADQGRRHRPDQYRLASQIFRQQGIFRSCAGPEQGRGGMAGQEAGEACRRRYARPSIIRWQRRSARTATARRSNICCRNTKKRPAAKRSRISRNGIRRIGRCSKPASRPSKTSAAISMN